MALKLLSRVLPKPQSLLSRSFSTTTTTTLSPSRSTLLRALSSVAATRGSHILSRASSAHGFSTQATSSSLNDPNPNWSNRPPKETILLDGCDFEHWLVVMEKPEGDPTRDEIIDKYIKTLAQVVGSEQEARMKIYSVSTRCYYAFGALVSEELSYKLKELPGVRWVLPDSYLDVKNKDYGGEPFINGQAVPYDPKYHEEWIKNNSRANERNRRNDRPRNFDRSRNFERRRENMQNRDFQNTAPPNQGMQNNPMPNQGMQNNPMPNQGLQNNAMPNQGMQNPGMPPQNRGFQPNHGGPPPNPGYGHMQNAQNYPPNQQGYPPNQQGYPPNQQGYPPNQQGYPPNQQAYAPNQQGYPPHQQGYGQN